MSDSASKTAVLLNASLWCAEQEASAAAAAALVNCRQVQGSLTDPFATVPDKQVDDHVLSETTTNSASVSASESPRASPRHDGASAERSVAANSGDNSDPLAAKSKMFGGLLDSLVEFASQELMVMKEEPSEQGSTAEPDSRSDREAPEEEEQDEQYNEQDDDSEHNPYERPWQSRSSARSGRSDLQHGGWVHEDPGCAREGLRPRRNRPRSISNPEGMETAAWRKNGNGALGSLLKGSNQYSQNFLYTRGTEDGMSSVKEEYEEYEEHSTSKRPPRIMNDSEAVSVPLPHLLLKYANVYNKHGRIGIYTQQEREAIIARFKAKRLRRVWRKKIRYNCRKNLADKRLRIKGRFVKMSPQQRAALAASGGAGQEDGADPDDMDEEPAYKSRQPRRRGRSSSIISENSHDEEEEDNEEDKIAYKKTRRHSIAY